MHKLESLTHFEQLSEETAGFIQIVLRSTTKETSDHQMAFHELMLLSYKEGCIAFILGRKEELTRECFRRAADYGIQMLGVREGREGLRSFEVDLEGNEQGLTSVQIRARPIREGERKLSIDKFITALDMIAAFGVSAAIKVVAEFPEVSYTANPNVIADASTLANLRARRAWLRGDTETARREGRAALSQNTNERVKPAIAAFLSVVDGDEATFALNLKDVARVHKKSYQKHPHVAEGAVCFAGMSLCRMALDRGFPVVEQPYLPIRFLPNYRVA
jgi:hypothetical protein